MKKLHKRPTRKQRVEHTAHTCTNCGTFTGSKYQVKQHKEFCNG